LIGRGKTQVWPASNVVQGGSGKQANWVNGREWSTSCAQEGRRVFIAYIKPRGRGTITRKIPGVILAHALKEKRKWFRSRAAR